MGWGTGRWADEDAGMDVLRGRGEALEGSPAMDSVDGAGGGWVSEMEAVGGFEGWRGVPEVPGGGGRLVAK